MVAEVTQMKQIAEQPARGRGDYDRPGLGQRLEAGSQIRRVPGHRMLLGDAGSPASHRAGPW